MPTSPDRRPWPLEPSIVEILRCPATGSRLTVEGDELIATEDPAIRYPITNGVPRLLTDSADPKGHS